MVSSLFRVLFAHRNTYFTSSLTNARGERDFSSFKLIYVKFTRILYIQNFELEELLE